MRHILCVGAYSFGELLQADFRVADGRAEGRAEALKEIARKMKRGGMDDKLIMQFTGLKAEDIALL